MAFRWDFDRRNETCSYGWQTRISLNVRKVIERQLSESLDYENSDATKKISGFLPQYFSTSLIFKTEFLMEEFEFVEAREYKFENGAK